jgi:SAM-dependent methyltransferase
MGGDERAASSAEPPSVGGNKPQHGGLHRLMKALFELTPWGLRRRITLLTGSQQRSDARVDLVERRLDALEEALRVVQSELAELRDKRFVAAEVRLDEADSAIGSLTHETTRLRDLVVPAAVGRADALLERLAAELEELGSLVERMMRREPLPVPGTGVADSKRLSSALAEVQPALLEAFRGTEAEISHRLDHYLGALRRSAPVLDLGCGRGELLLLLREAGVASTGVEGDPAVAQSARRRGLDILGGDILEVLRTLPDESRGAVTAIHVFEHLEPATLLEVLAEVRRVLRAGGLVIGESPNPHSLRVGASLYWVDPTHRRPLMPETLELYLKSSGFEVERRELLHPFPAEQCFADPLADAGPEGTAGVAALAERLDRLGRRLDELINGPRDFAVWARKPESVESLENHEKPTA